MTNEEIKTTELTDEALKSISGGVQRNDSQHYTFHDGETLIWDHITYVVKGDYENVEAGTIITTIVKDALRHEEYEVIFKADYLYTMWQYNRDPSSR